MCTIMADGNQVFALLALFIGGLISPVLGVTEYQAMVPETGGPTKLHWVQIDYPSDVSRVADVTFRPLNSSVPEVGAWFDLDTVVGVGVSAKIMDDGLYCLMSYAEARDPFGCCADHIRVYNRTTGDYREINIGSIVHSALPENVTWAAGATHTFDVVRENGEIFIYLIVDYYEPALNTRADAIVAFNAADGLIRRTADGASSFKIFSEVGDVSDAPGPFKVQFTKAAESTTNAQQAQWHGNGIQRFTSKGGIGLLAFTHRTLAEAVIVKCPFAYARVQGGGTILQRFGNPAQYKKGQAVGKHYYGMEEAGIMGEITGGAHNVFYTQDSSSFGGQETISFFVNKATGNIGPKSPDLQRGYAVEFVLNLVEEQADRIYTDSIFSTEYVAAELSYGCIAEGGTRAIGKGVLLTMSGVMSVGLEVVDVEGGKHSYPYPGTNTSAPVALAKLYDPFAFVRAQSIIV